MNSNRFGENMINYIEMKDSINIVNGYNDDTLKMKTLVITDEKVKIKNISLDKGGYVILHNNKYKLDLIERLNIECLDNNFVIVLKLINLEVIDINSKDNYYIIKEVDVYIKNITKEKIKNMRRVITSLLNNSVNNINKVFDMNFIKEDTYLCANDFSYKLKK